MYGYDAGKIISVHVFFSARIDYIFAPKLSDMHVWALGLIIWGQGQRKKCKKEFFQAQESM